MYDSKELPGSRSEVPGITFRSSCLHSAGNVEDLFFILLHSFTTTGVSMAHSFTTGGC